MMIFVLFVVLQNYLVNGQSRGNQDESKVQPYTLPSLLLTSDGKTVKNVTDWEKNQRPYLLQQFTKNVYGRIPGRPANMHFKVISENHRVLNGKATRKQVRIFFGEGETVPYTTLLIYLPVASQKVTVFVGLNFDGNHNVNIDTGIVITDQWLKLNGKTDSIVRGRQSRRWPVEELIRNGYGVATAWYQDFEPDFAEGWKTGIRSGLKEDLRIQPEEWGAIAAWSWGLSRIVDYLVSDPAIDSGKIILTGHSRLGKAALWAAVNDDRFKLVIANNSGEGGAALSRRNFGETIKDLNNSFPHWFIDRYKSYNDNVGAMPVDQHMLLALIAPRPLYVASASADLWADPRGEFLSANHAGDVYSLYGKKGISVKEMPSLEKPVGETVRYHVRNGEHDILLFDWLQYIRFADELLK